MLLKIVVICAAVCGIFGAEDECDKSKCAGIPKHYEEIGCKPVEVEGKCCPVRFDCSKVMGIDSTKCFYKDQIFSEGDPIESSKTSSLCSAACRCSNRFGKFAGFECAQIECPDLFQRPDPECIQQYEDGSCCSKRTICDKAEIEKLETCKFEGKTYREGQKIYPEKGCYTCKCVKGFEDKPAEENPNCKKVDCGIGLRNLDRIRAGCIPIYYGNDRCCPIEWQCPDGEEKIIEQARSENPDPDMKCTYGKLQLNVGDVINSSDKCNTCTCSVPPLAHCIKDRKCYMES